MTTIRSCVLCGMLCGMLCCGLNKVVVVVVVASHQPITSAMHHHHPHHALWSSFDTNVRVLVIGDTAVGKSSIVEVIKHIDSKAPTRSHLDSNAMSWPSVVSPTIGCSCQVVRHLHHGVEYLIEMLDVGGLPKYRAATSVFFSNYDGWFTPPQHQPIAMV
jgi:hypothetical protein